MTIGAMTSTRLICLALLHACLAALPAYGQEARIQIDSLAQLEAKADEVVEVTLDERMIRIAEKLLSDKRSTDEAKIKELVKELKGVYVKVFKFKQAGEYTAADLEPVRAQLRAPGWERIVGVRSRSGGENVEVYLMGDTNHVQGLTIIAAEPDELVLVNIVGPIDLEKLSELEGSFGIPRLELKFSRKPPKE
jgi:hypothetical protein